MKYRYIYDNLDTLFKTAPSLEINKQDKIVIFSDLHMGNGTTRDDFFKNAPLFSYILEQHYLNNDFKLILNGDVEELQKFSIIKIMSRWSRIYQLFDRFNEKKQLIRIIGNHDYELTQWNEYINHHEILPAIKLYYGDDTIFVFHGHQASAYLEKHNQIAGIVLRYVAKPLHIKNHSTAYDSNRKFRVEKKVYEFSTRKKILTIIGHTHRPLFESLSKVDYLKFKIEQLCRNYIIADNKEKSTIEKYIRIFKQELKYVSKKQKRSTFGESLYNSNILVPCMFNSGCAIGKRGITAIEILNSKIYLVHWFDRRRKEKYLKFKNGHPPEQIGETSYYKTILKEDQLANVFTRIRLLT